MARRYALAAIILMAAIGAWAISTDRISYVVTHGVSMKPTYHQGDLVFVVRTDSYDIGEIAAYHDAKSRVEVLHRIIGGDATSGYTFKGDNNASIDIDKPTADRLIGRAVLHIPKGGVWLQPLLSPTGLGMLGFLFVGGSGAARTRREIPRGRRKKKVKAMSSQGSPWATALLIIKAVKRLPPLLRASAAVVAVLAGLAIALGVLGWMKPVTAKIAAGPGTRQSMTFAYSTTVPRSAAYDGTTVTSPEPIFRKLADTIDVQLRYQGHPGALALTAALTNGTGWHTTLQLMPAQKFSGKSHAAAVPLNLGAIEDRAEAASKAIGVEPTPVSITLMARVTAAGIPDFTAPLQLALSPLQLTLTGGAAALVVSDTASAGPTATPREIKIFGQTITTAAQARSYAILLLLGALLGAGAIALVTRRGAPLRNRTEIERRYPQLLVPVEPMASPPGKPVVTVDNFPALVRLAERYGQMILTWRRPDADDFIVRDEGITYRYRIPLDEPALHNIEHINRPSSAGSHRRKAPTQVS